MKNNNLIIQAENTFNTLIDLLNELKWEYSSNKNDLSVRCVLSGRDLPVEINFVCDKVRGILSVFSHLPFKTAKKANEKMALAVCMVNQVLLEGNFDFDYLNGSLLFRTGTVFKDSVISKQAITHLIKQTLATVYEYNDKLYTVSRGIYTLEGLKKYLNGGV